MYSFPPSLDAGEVCWYAQRGGRVDQESAQPGMATSWPVSDGDAAAVPGVLLPVGIQLAYGGNGSCCLRLGVSEACTVGVPSSGGGGTSARSGLGITCAGHVTSSWMSRVGH
eukprot:2548382-Rhodomonas_salina.2